MSHANAAELEKQVRQEFTKHTPPSNLSIEQTRRGRLDIAWETNGKKCRVFASPSGDPHAVRNTMSIIRRQIAGAGGVLHVAAQTTNKLQKALALPLPTQSYGEQIAGLIRDVDMVVDLVHMLAEKLGVDLNPKPPELPKPEPVAAQPAQLIKRVGRGYTGRPHSKAHELLLCVSYDWTPVAKITQQAGRTPGAVSVALDKLKKRGLVENGSRKDGTWGMWRKVLHDDAPPVAPVAAAPTLTPPPPTKPTVLDVMEYGYLPVGVIASRLGISAAALSARLTYYSKKGLIENGTRGMWRKVRRANGHHHNGHEYATGAHAPHA